MMFGIYYDLDGCKGDVVYEVTKVDNLFDAELVAVVGSGKRLCEGYLEVSYVGSLDYAVFVDGELMGHFKIRSL